MPSPGKKTVNKHQFGSLVWYDNDEEEGEDVKMDPFADSPSSSSPYAKQVGGAASSSAAPFPGDLSSPSAHSKPRPSALGKNIRRGPSVLAGAGGVNTSTTDHQGTRGLPHDKGSRTTEDPLFKELGHFVNAAACPQEAKGTTAFLIPTTEESHVTEITIAEPDRDTWQVSSSLRKNPSLRRSL